jgi:preprotein translocase subunit SecE
VARNRKRAKERRSRRPTAGQVSRPGVATARADRDAREAQPDGLEMTPSAIEHATPDVELAEAQLALGRPELTDRSPDESADDELDGEPAEFLGDGLRGSSDGRSGSEGGNGSGGGDGSQGSELAASDAPAPAPRQVPGNRLINFLQGSWRELQRVQWPNRPQVMQATGVVIGFVIVAGVFLGLADTVAGKLVTLILK